VKRNLKIFFAASFVILVLLDLLLGGEAHGLMGVHFPGLFSLFGLVSCLIIILASKWLGHYWLQRKEDYYRGKERDD